MVFIGIGALIVFNSYRDYLDELIYHERLNQMTEVTEELYSSMDMLMRNEWKTAQFIKNWVISEKPETVEQLTENLKELQDIYEAGTNKLMPIVIDDNGRYYSASGKKGVIYNVEELVDCKERISSVTNIFGTDATDILFIYKLDEPVSLGDTTILYCGYIKDLSIIIDCYHTDAFSGQSIAYVMNGTGTKLYSTDLEHNSQVFAGFVLVVILIIILVISMRMQQQEQLYRKERENSAKLEVSREQAEKSRHAAEEAFKVAEAANNSKSSFLSNMSHDIRTPMNAIVGFSDLLERDADDPQKVREYTKKIKSSSQHLLGLINDVLDMSKIESGNTTLNLTNERIADIIDGVETIIRPQMQAKGHLFEVVAHDIKQENIVVDKLRLNQILLNLLSNACKYTPNGGHIVFSVTELPRRSPQFVNLRFVVQDNGYGMTEEYAATIFDAFEKSSPGQCAAILMDVQMPVMNGLEATKAIRSSAHPLAVTILIIAMTANAFAEDIHNCLEAGMNAHVSKPIDMTVLEQTVQRALSLESGEKQ